ncbi:hypothetical protein DIPPA_01547 [Diplonema papillatum]|nr:hypothetical protein DIPPA_01547 [Diplonema papillatum]
MGSKGKKKGKISHDPFDDSSEEEYGGGESSDVTVVSDEVTVPPEESFRTEPSEAGNSSHGTEGAFKRSSVLYLGSTQPLAKGIEENGLNGVIVQPSHPAVAKPEEEQQSWWSIGGLASAMTSVVNKLVGGAEPAEPAATSQLQPPPASEQPRVLKEPDPDDVNEARLISAIEYYSAVVKQGLDTSNDVDAFRQPSAEENALRAAKYAIFMYLSKHQITTKVWKCAHLCPTVWVMIFILEEGGGQYLVKEVQHSVDCKLNDPKGECAPASTPDDNLKFFRGAFSLPGIRVTSEHKIMLQNRGAEWEQLLYTYPHIHDEIPPDCRENLEATWMKPVVVLCGLVFMYAEIAAAAYYAYDLRETENDKWSNYSIIVYLAGGFMVFIGLWKVSSDMADANAVSLPYFPQYWLKAIPVLPVLESIVAWHYIRAVVFPMKYPLDIPMETPLDNVDNRHIILWDLRALFHFTRQLHALFISFPFALFGAYISQFQLKDGEYNNGNLILAVQIAFINVARALIALCWHLYTARNVTLWGMKQTFSYPPFSAPNPIVKLAVFVLLYYLMFQIFVLAIGLEHNRCGAEYNSWLIGQGLIAVVVIVVFRIVNTRDTGDDLLRTTLIWLTIPCVLRIGWVTLGWILVFGRNPDDCLKIREYASASVICDSIFVLVFVGFVLYYFVKGVIDGKVCASSRKVETAPDNESSEEETESYEESSGTLSSSARPSPR